MLASDFLRVQVHIRILRWHLFGCLLTNKHDRFDTIGVETIVLFLFIPIPMVQGFSTLFSFGLVSLSEEKVQSNPCILVEHDPIF